jgi:SAM-dependent methyltransferase/PAS domain-containing protein
MKRLAMALSFVILGLILGAFLKFFVNGIGISGNAVEMLWVVAVVAPLVGVLIALGFKKIPLGFLGTIEIPDVDHKVLDTPPRELSPEVEAQRRGYAEQKKQQLPGRFAPAFHLLDEKLALTATPYADPMTPMYVLDRNFRIIDWNLALSLCFDRTLEGRRGQNILEWTYFFDNYEEVLNHGIEVFGEGRELPRIDLEEIRYTSHRYGLINGTKRAYQVPDDDGSCLGWLITINPTFVQSEMATLYQADLFSALHKALMWSEYALCYDKVLNNSLIYPALINTLIGHHNPGPDPIREGTVILDLGAGTGNLTYLLAKPPARRLVISIDDNSVMLNVLRQKCESFLRRDAQGPGVIAIKQDISSLYGLNDGFFDYVVLNNVLYSLELEAMKSCLKVLDQIGLDLKRNNRYAELEKEYRKLRQINEFSLAPMLRRWSLEETKGILRHEVGFTQITYASDKVYAGQSMLVCAQKG